MPHQLVSNDWEVQLGQQLRSLRLRRNIDQRQLAQQAGVALNAVKNLEAGRGATVTSLVKVLRALDRADWLHALAPTVSISPMQMLRSSPVRRRATPKKGKTTRV